jgi:hypothetical protein
MAAQDATGENDSKQLKPFSCLEPSLLSLAFHLKTSLVAILCLSFMTHPARRILVPYGTNNVGTISQTSNPGVALDFVSHCLN